MGWYDRKLRRVRDLSCGDTRIFLEAEVRRLDCRQVWLVASVVWVCTVGAVTCTTMPTVVLFDQLPDSKTPPREVDPPLPPQPWVTIAERNAFIQRSVEFALVPMAR
jgi:hypothetical protein